MFNYIHDLYTTTELLLIRAPLRLLVTNYMYKHMCELLRIDLTLVQQLHQFKARMQKKGQFRFEIAMIIFECSMLAHLIFDIISAL